MPSISIHPAFLALEAAGRFDYWGAPYASSSPEQRAARLRTHATQVLWWRPIEWDRSSAQIAAFAGDEFLRPGLVPFAGNGYGDSYCWYPRWQEGSEAPIVLALHDEYEGELFAMTFAHCLTRCFLQTFAEPDAAKQFHLPPDVIWDAHFEILLPYLSAPEVSLLRRVRADFSPASCESADTELASSLPERTLVALQPPTRYNHDALAAEHLPRLYDEAIAFFTEVVEVEGHSELAWKLQAVKNERRAL